MQKRNMKTSFQNFILPRLKKRKPITINYNGDDIFTNSAPSFGGSLIIFLLKLLKDSNSKINILNLIKTMNLTSLARDEVCNNPDDENQINEIFSDKVYNKYYNVIKNDFANPINGFGSTTHVSILDKKGNAASITTTNGEGGGYIIPEYGRMMK